MKLQISQNRTFLMGLAMIAVILFHHGITIIPGITPIFSRFGLWGVDIFLFLSGFGCVYAIKKYPTQTFLKRRLLRLLPTCLIIGILVYSTDLYISAEKTQAFPLIRILSLHRWYIQAIILCYLICPFAYTIICKFKSKGLISICLIAVALECVFPDINLWKIKWIMGRLPVFFIGMYIGEFDLKTSKLTYIISAICLILAMITRCRGGYYIFNWTYFLAAAMPCICETLCRLREVMIRIHIYRLIEVLGLYSLEIYLIHEYTGWALYSMNIPIWSKYVAFLLVVTVGCWLTKISVNKLCKVF